MNETITPPPFTTQERIELMRKWCFEKGLITINEYRNGISQETAEKWRKEETKE